MSTLISLNSSIHMSIGEFLGFQSDDFIQLCHVSRCFLDLKYKMYYVKVNYKWSQVLFGRLLSLKKQLESENRLNEFGNLQRDNIIRFNKFSLEICDWNSIENPINDLTIVQNAYDLSLFKCRNITDLSPLQNMHSVVLCKCAIVTDVSPLRYIHSLKLESLASLADVSALANVKELSLEHCHEVKDVSHLGSVRSLTILKCDGITDVSALGTVLTLRLRVCNNITEILALSTVHDLDIEDCPRTFGLTGGTIYSLRICSHPNISDVSSFGTVKHLELWNCPNITDVSALSAVQNLKLGCCQAVTNVNSLRNVPSLSLAWCNAKSDVSAAADLFIDGSKSLYFSDLKHVSKIKLRKCGLLKFFNTSVEPHEFIAIDECGLFGSFTSAGSIQKLRFYSCQSLKHIRLYNVVSELTLHSCGNTIDLTSIGSGVVNKLRIISCPKVVDVSSLSSIQDLYLENLHIVDVSALSNVPKLTLRECHQVTDVSSLQGVHSLTIDRCAKILSLSNLESVPFLIFTTRKDFEKGGSHNPYYTTSTGFSICID